MKFVFLLITSLLLFYSKNQDKEYFEGNIFYEVNTPSGESDTILIQLREDAAKVIYGKLAKRYGMDTLYIISSNGQVDLFYYNRSRKKIKQIKSTQKVKISPQNETTKILQYSCDVYYLEYEGAMYEDVLFTQNFQVFSSNLISPIRSKKIVHPFVSNSTGEIALKVIQENYEGGELKSHSFYEAIKVEVDSSKIFFPELYKK